MSSSLEQIAEFAQQVAKVSSSALGLEVSIHDDRIKLVASTGKLIKEIGSYYGKGSLTDNLLSTGGFHIVENTKTYPLCQKCPRREECQFLAALVGPITVDNKIIGSLGVTATTEEQKEKLLGNVGAFNDFAKQLSDLLAIAIKEKEARKSLSLLTGKYQAVVNSIYEGIISVDPDGTITHFNKSAQRMLPFSLDKLVGKNITEVFPDLSLQEALDHQGYMTRELRGKKGRKGTYIFAGIITPIMNNKKVSGLTISLREMQEMQRLAGDLVGYEALLTFDDIVGNSPAIHDIKQKFAKAAITDSTILIRGESGTGKDLFARAIHAHSMRSKGPFVTINCAAIPETLLESELFGYEEGAFTGARRGGKPGKFELAHEGTIFLDEIGDMPLHLQVKLLRVLEENSIERIGGTQAVSIDVRVIAATHRNLEKMISDNEFREDLYYRLSVIPVTIPPLRERTDDARLLIDYFVKKYSRKMNKRVLGLSGPALERMLDYEWRGNVRELENAIEYAINMVGGDYIEAENLPARVAASGAQRPGKPEMGTIRDLERQAILDALDRFGHHGAGKKEAARFLGVSLSTIYRKLRDN